MNIFEAAEMNWPEDEAAALRDYIDSEYGPGTAEHAEQLQTQGEDIAKRCFDREQDSAELRRRFFARLNRQ